MKLTLPCLMVSATLLSACDLGVAIPGSASGTSTTTPQRGQLVVNLPTATGTLWDGGSLEPADG